MLEVKRFSPAVVAGIAFVTISVFALTGCPGTGSGSETVGTIEGTWSGTLVDIYYCEGGAVSIELSTSGSTVTITGGTISEGSFPVGTSGTISQQGDDPHAYTLSFVLEGTAPGLLYVDPSVSYAAILLQYEYSTYGMLGVLKKGELSLPTYSESNLVGTWVGAAYRLGNDFQVTSSSTSSATITNPDGLALSGTDGDGAFSALAAGIGLDSNYGQSFGIYESGLNTNEVRWGVLSYPALYALSPDKYVLAAAFLEGLCDSSVFENLPNQKFAIWVRH